MRRLSVKKGLMLQQAITSKVCSWGARGECRRGLSDDFNVNGEVEIGGEAPKIKVPSAVVSGIIAYV